jgi:hypothetical protein
MAYKNRPLSSIVDKMFIDFMYYDTTDSRIYYQKTVDVIVETIGDLYSSDSFTLIFKFIVPDDFPPPNQIVRFDWITILLYHSEEGREFININSDNMIYLFGKNLSAGEEAKLTFVIPRLTFNIFSQ